MTDQKPKTINVDELVDETNDQFQAEERMYFCRDAAIRIRCAHLYGITTEQAWKEAEALWDAKPEHL
jgi:hypothetical protein